jgi:Na+-driven multidrug efflux pump
MSLAAATLAGQYLGAKSPRLARIAVHRTAAIGASLMGVFGLGFIFYGARITGLLTQVPIHLELVPQLLIVCGLVQVPFAMSIIYRSALRGAGDTNVVMWITWISTYAIRLPLAWLFCGVEIPLPGGGVIPNPAPLQNWWGIHPLVGFWIGLCGELILRAIFFTGYFLTDRWTRAKV